jgi:hypothetical protein
LRLSRYEKRTIPLPSKLHVTKKYALAYAFN